MNIRFLLAAVGLFAATSEVAFSATGESGIRNQGDEYAVTRILPGDQVYPSAALTADGGYLVWEDNATDGDGSGISAVRLGPALSAAFDSFRVNVAGSGDQGKPSVAVLEGGGAVFVWQSGNSILARFLDSSGVFATETDVAVNTHLGTRKVNPVVTSMKNGGAFVLWASYGQDDVDNPESGGAYRNLQGVYGQQFDEAGERVGGEFLVNQQVAFNQRNPSVARLSSGKLIAVWVSERMAFNVFEGQVSEEIEGVEIKGRFFGESGEPMGDEFLVSLAGVIAASPSVCSSGDGFVVAWCQRDPESRDLGFDIFSRTFNSAGVASAEPIVINDHRYGDQFAPSIAASRGGELVVWTSLLQDGSREGVYGHYLANGSKQGGEFLVNTTVASRQIHPRAVARGDDGFLALWSGFLGSPRAFEILGQRYSMTLPPAPSPIVSALSANRLTLAWPSVGGYDDLEYLVYMEGGVEPAVTSDAFWSTPATLQPATTYSFRLAYRLSPGTVSPLSNPAAGTTWGTDENFDGLPDDWQAAHWGASTLAWPAPGEDSDGDGMSNRDEFLAGTDPTDASKVLRTSATQTEQGAILSWNTVPGQAYQVQESPDLKTWTALGGARLARSATDQLLISGPSAAQYYRVIRLR